MKCVARCCRDGVERLVLEVCRENRVNLAATARTALQAPPASPASPDLAASRASGALTGRPVSRDRAELTDNPGCRESEVRVDRCATQ